MWIISKRYGASVLNWQNNLDEILTLSLTAFLTFMFYIKVAEENNNKKLCGSVIHSSDFLSENASEGEEGYGMHFTNK